MQKTEIFVVVGLYWMHGETVFLFLSVTVAWLYWQPLKKCCCDGRWTEVLFNLIPMEMPLLLIFAQWHFVLFAGDLLLLALAELALLIILKKDERKYRSTKRRRRMYKDAFKRGSVLMAFLVTAVPCFLSLFVYKLRGPEYRAEDDLAKLIFSEEASDDEAAEAVDIYQENIELLSCFEEQRWENFDKNEKITIVQKLADFEADCLGVPSVPVSSCMLDVGTLGSYSSETKEIKISLPYMAESSAEECIQTICHEVFHRAQDYLVENLDWENEVLQSAYFDELRSWKENQENYKDVWTAGFDAYENQPLEASARDYAAKETDMILSYIGEQPDDDTAETRGKEPRQEMTED